MAVDIRKKNLWRFCRHDFICG